MSNTIRCPEQLGIADVAELHREIVSAIRAGGSLHLDARECARIDAAGVQLLCAAVLALRRRGQTLHLDAHPAVSSALDELGVRALVEGEPDASPSAAEELPDGP
jgi:anti-anti-sigma regulatory factor